MLSGSEFHILGARKLRDLIPLTYHFHCFLPLAAKRYLRKTQVVDPGKHKPKEKRSIEVGDDSWVNLDNGKDLLVAYLGGIADYRRQTRSVDDEDEDDLESSDGMISNDFFWQIIKIITSIP